MSEPKAGRIERSRSLASRVVRRTIEDSSFTRFWFVAVAIVLPLWIISNIPVAVAFGVTLILPLGCMSPATKHFSLFSINPHDLAFRYNERLENVTGAQPYDQERLDMDLHVLPDLYRFGISGVCREFANQSKVNCTKRFMQPLDFDAIIKQDISESSLSSSAASHLQSFWDSWSKNMTGNTQSDKRSRDSMIRASAALTVTSLVVGPIGIAIAIGAYVMDLSSRRMIAVSIALFDASLMIPAATLWIVASARYADAFRTTLAGQEIANSHVYGLLVFFIAAVAKLCVLPILAFIILVVFPILFIIAVVIFVWLMLLFFQCLLACCPATTTTTTTYYGTTYDSGWGGDS